MTKIQIEIKSCKECPFFQLGGKYSTDGFDIMQDWLCGKSKKKIEGAVEWHEENRIEVPAWCEIRCQDFTQEELGFIKGGYAT